MFTRTNSFKWWTRLLIRWDIFDIPLQKTQPWLVTMTVQKRNSLKLIKNNFKSNITIEMKEFNHHLIWQLIFRNYYNLYIITFTNLNIYDNIELWKVIQYHNNCSINPKIVTTHFLHSHVAFQMHSVYLSLIYHSFCSINLSQHNYIYIFCINTNTSKFWILSHWFHTFIQ